jgi:protein MpaA
VRAVHDDLVAFRPDVVLVLHSSYRGPFVNFDGPARELAAAFASRAGPPWRVEDEMGYATPGSLGSWMGDDLGVPILTVELERGVPAAESRAALLAGIQAVLDAAPRGHLSSR